MDEQRVVATGPRTEDLEVAWRDHRRQVFDVAYRMLGSVSDQGGVTLPTTGAGALRGLAAGLVLVGSGILLSDLARLVKRRCRGR